MDKKPKQPRIAVGAAIIENDKILLIERKKAPEAGHWALPGGKLDLYETCETAVIRETFEETGLILKDPFLLAIMNMWDEKAAYHWVAPIYLFTEYEGTPEIKEPSKHSGLNWFNIYNLPPNITNSVKTAINAFLVK